MTILKLNAFSELVYGVMDNGDVVVTRTGEGVLLCEIDARTLAWELVPAAKVPVTLRRWMEER